jgi:hypothetical protein
VLSVCDIAPFAVEWQGCACRLGLSLVWGIFHGIGEEVVKYLAQKVGQGLVVETFDEAYNSWCMGSRKHRWNAAEERAGPLIERLGANMTLYLRFLRCDNETGSKQPDSVKWFMELVRARGIKLPPDMAED